ncbi:hypothetical protein THAOC_20110 [Thalassiosira oceanica]|uniref:Uncharacterized protein n=1 Tax=Thalassiosira oceanica TaxID=159749 RepID=K0S0Q4_THAOC|nr:hypothetical protein THAOC_20110 [Thalassiosira oceanica]|eukprot:EJK59633.1 hypothetical protein THAOC_20110 [Thalassiosira oceanica]
MKLSLRERTSTQAMNEVLALTTDPDYGITGTGASTPWVWIVLGILVGVILIICAVGCYRKRAAANEPNEDEKEGGTIGTINDAVSESGLDEPLL